MNSPQRPFVVLALPGDQTAAGLPGGHDREDGDTDEQRQPGPVHQLGQVGHEEQEVDQQEYAPLPS